MKLPTILSAKIRIVALPKETRLFNIVLKFLFNILEKLLVYFPILENPTANVFTKSLIKPLKLAANEPTNTFIDFIENPKVSICFASVIKSPAILDINVPTTEINPPIVLTEIIIISLIYIILAAILFAIGLRLAKVLKYFAISFIEDWINPLIILNWAIKY